MRAILDTHALLWFANGADEISPKALELIRDPDTHLFVSIASLWEIAIKVRIGKLPLRSSLAQFIAEEVDGNMIETLHIESAHLETVSRLPLHHRDPFDRMIIAQALSEDMAVISADAAFDAYGVDLLW